MTEEEDISKLETEELNPLPAGAEWSTASKDLTRLGDLSALFTSCSRSLIQCSKTGSGQLSKIASSQLNRLLGSPSILAQLLYAARTYYNKDITSRGSIEPADFSFFIAPDEMALMITVGYTTRRLTRLLDPQDWQLLNEPFQRYADLSIPLGFAIPAIGPTHALMTAAGKFLGWGILNLKDAERFKKYRVANKIKKRSFSLSDEIETFGTSHLHIASLIWQRFGFGIHNCEEYFLGLSDASNQELSPGAIKFRVARLWLESLLEQGEPPTQSLGDNYDLEASRSEKFIDTFNSIKNHGSEFKWLTRTREDISKEKTPELIVDYVAMKKASKSAVKNKIEEAE